MSVVKIPLIIALTYTFNVMFTPPNPSPKKEELVSTSSIDLINGRSLILKISRTGQLLLSIFEIVILIAGIFPSSGISQKLLSILWFEGRDPSTLRLRPLSYLAAFLWTCGAAIRMSTYQELGRFFRFDISIQEEHQLVTTGLYTYIRHPSYTGIILADLGWGLWHGTRGSWLRESAFLNSIDGKVALALFVLLFMLPAPVWTLSRMSNEDKALRRQFGRQWDDWAGKVRYRIIPGIY